MHALTSTIIVAEAGANTGPDLTRYFVVCGVLLGAITLLAWGFKKLIAGNLSARAMPGRKPRVKSPLPSQEGIGELVG